MLSIVLLFLKSQWKKFAIGALIVAVLMGAYLKGRRDCAEKMEKEVVKEISHREEEVLRERSRTDTIKHNIRVDRELHPQNDKRDSCILSNDPFEVNCLEDK